MDEQKRQDPVPGVPDALRYVDLRLPWTFRSLVADSNFTDEEIGIIVRCLALDVDRSLTIHTTPQVAFYRKKLIKQNKSRLRVERFRNKKLDVTGGALTATVKQLQDYTERVTVTRASSEPKIANTPPEETPNIPIEKIPPIVPLEKNPPSFLEKVTDKRGSRSKKKRSANQGLEADLFSAVEVVEPEVIPPIKPQKPPVARLKASDVITVVQDIASDPSGVSGSSVPTPDTREDMAWIPQQFAKFWQEYPRKVAKSGAMKAFAKLIKAQTDVDAFMSTLMASLAWWKTQDAWTKDNGKYIPHPATWLNRGSWEDSKDNAEAQALGAQFLNDVETDEDLIRRMQGG